MGICRYNLKCELVRENLLTLALARGVSLNQRLAYMGMRVDALGGRSVGSKGRLRERVATANTPPIRRRSNTPKQNFGGIRTPDYGPNIFCRSFCERMYMTPPANLNTTSSCPLAQGVLCESEAALTLGDSGSNHKNPAPSMSDERP